MKKQIKVSFLYTLYATIGLGVIYPMTLATIGLLFPSSPPALLQKPIDRADLFHGRPSGASNLALTSKELAQQVESRLKLLKEQNPGTTVPSDLLFASASGYDPDISVEAARFQIPRIAKARNIDKGILENLVTEHAQAKLWGFVGAEKINVVELNEALAKESHNSKILPLSSQQALLVEQEQTRKPAGG